MNNEIENIISHIQPFEDSLKVNKYIEELKRENEHLKTMNDGLEQQNKELRELLDDVIAVLVCHEQSYDSEWLKDYQDVYSRYEQIIT